MATTGADKARSYSGDYMDAGRNAEDIVMAFLRDHPDVVGVEDWRELRAVQEADVDCAIKTRDGRVTLAEIKSDKHLGVSGNVLFEIFRINHTCRSDRSGYLGWSCRSPATYFLYYAPTIQKLYQCRVEKLRAAMQTYTKTERKKTRLDWVDTDSIKSTINILIPWRYCKDIFTIFDVSMYCNSSKGNRT